MSTAHAEKQWFGHPAGLSTLFFTEMWERLSYYGMRALLILYMTADMMSDNPGLGFTAERAATIYGTYTALVYALALPGGIIADRWLGHYRAVFIGGAIITLGHFALAIQTLPFFFGGLALIILGTGLLKPNISTMVGNLYEQGDARREGGFSLFYMGINVGAAAAPFVCGTLGQKVGWHWGFAAAGVGMVFGLIQYHFGRGRLESSIARIEANKAKEDKERAERKASGASASSGFTPQEWQRLGVIAVLFIFSTMFWAAFEQAGTSLNLFADRFTNTSVFGWSFPSTWFQSLNPLYIVIFAPLFSIFWVALDRRGKEPSAPMKFVWGMVLASLGFLLLLPAARYVQGGEGLTVGPQWLVGVYLFHTLGELCLSPVSLSMVTKLAPQKIVGSMMGFWFLSYALGNFVSGWIASFFERLPLEQIFGAVFIATFGAGLILLLMVKPLSKMMHGIK